MTNRPVGRKRPSNGGPASPVMGIANNLFFVLVVLALIIAGVILAVTQL